MDDIFCNLIYFDENRVVNMKNDKNCESYLESYEKIVFFFLEFLYFQAPGVNICAPNFKNS
jgi:hypothetical protein